MAIGIKGHEINETKAEKPLPYLLSIVPKNLIKRALSIVRFCSRATKSFFPQI
jgi:hypothetical protein